MPTLLILSKTCVNFAMFRKVVNMRRVRNELSTLLIPKGQQFGSQNIGDRPFKAQNLLFLLTTLEAR
jgi:hypothetical protein